MERIRKNPDFESSFSGRCRYPEDNRAFGSLVDELKNKDQKINIDKNNINFMNYKDDINYKPRDLKDPLSFVNNNYNYKIEHNYYIRKPNNPSNDEPVDNGVLYNEIRMQNFNNDNNIIETNHPKYNSKNGNNFVENDLNNLFKTLKRNSNIDKDIIINNEASKEINYRHYPANPVKLINEIHNDLDEILHMKDYRKEASSIDIGNNALEKKEAYNIYLKNNNNNHPYNHNIFQSINIKSSSSIYKNLEETNNKNNYNNRTADEAKMFYIDNGGSFKGFSKLHARHNSLHNQQAIELAYEKANENESEKEEIIKLIRPNSVNNKKNINDICNAFPIYPCFAIDINHNNNIKATNNSSLNSKENQNNKRCGTPNLGRKTSSKVLDCKNTNLLFNSYSNNTKKSQAKIQISKLSNNKQNKSTFKSDNGEIIEYKEYKSEKKPIINKSPKKESVSYSVTNAIADGKKINFLQKAQAQLQTQTNTKNFINLPQKLSENKNSLHCNFSGNGEAKLNNSSDSYNNKDTEITNNNLIKKSLSKIINYTQNTFRITKKQFNLSDSLKGSTKSRKASKEIVRTALNKIKEESEDESKNQSDTLS